MKKLNPSEYVLAQYARQVHAVTPPEGTTLEEMLDPAYWGHVSARFHQYDRIEVVPQGGAFYAELLVTNCSLVHAKVAVLHVKELQPLVKEEADKDFSIEFKGPNRKWSVLRAGDKAIVKDVFTSKEEARAWLTANRKDLTAGE